MTTMTFSWGGEGEGDNTDPTKEPDVTPQTLKKHVYVNGVEVAPNNIQASIPQVQPGAIIPMLIGTQLVTSPQVIWYGNYRLHYVVTTKEEEKTETIRQPSGYEFNDVEVTTTKTVTTYTPDDYYLTVVLGICLGPNVVLKSIIVKGEKVWTGSTVNGRNFIPIDSTLCPFRDLIFYSGQNDQTPDPLLEELIGAPNKVPGFVGTSYAIIENVLSKDYADLSIAFEVQRIDFNKRMPDVTDPSDENGDVNIAAAMWELMRSDWSAMGIPQNVYLDPVSWQEFYDIAEARGYYVSFIDASQDYGAAMLDSLQTLVGAVIYLDTADELIKVKEYYYSNYDPDTATLFDEDSVIEVQSLKRGSWNTLPTDFEIKYASREDLYKETSITRASRSINTDDKKSVERPMVLSAIPACTQIVAKKFLTRMIMHNGCPVMEINFTATSKAGNLTVGDAIKVTNVKRRLNETPFFIRNIVNSETELDQFTIEAFYFLRPDVDDFDDGPTASEFESPIVPAAAPTTALFLSDGLLPNVIKRLGAGDPYLADKRFGGYALLLVRAVNDRQSSVNVYSLAKGKPVARSAMPYAGSGLLDVAMGQNYKATEGYIAQLKLNSPTATAMIVGSKIGYCGGEWFSFDSVTFEAGACILHGVNRGLWGSPMKDHAPGAVFWTIDDNPVRLFGPASVGSVKSYTVTSNSIGGATQNDSSALLVTATFAANYDTMLQPSQIYLDGKRWLPGDVPTIYRGAPYRISWINRNRNFTDIIENNTGEGKSHEYLYNGHEGYFMDAEDGGANVVYIGATGAPGDEATSFTLESATINFDTLVALGPIRFNLSHSINSATSHSSATTYFNAYVADAPGLVVDFTYSYRVKFAVDFKMAWQIIN